MLQIERELVMRMPTGGKKNQSDHSDLSQTGFDIIIVIDTELRYSYFMRILGGYTSDYQIRKSCLLM